MPTTEPPFNWRAFWADLLQSSGRALLTLDGSDEARAALTGLDHFDAMQERRAQRTQDVAGNNTDATATQGRPWPERNEADIFSLPYPHWDALKTPAVRPKPMSANPFDADGLPVQVVFSPTGLPVIRRR